MIQTKRWDEKWDHEADGLRILICRYRPRALPKKKESWHLWWPQLGPSKELHAAFYGKTGTPISIEEYTQRYLEEMKGKEAQETIDLLVEKAAEGKTITLLCSSACTDPSRCHRTLLKQMLEERIGQLQPAALQTPKES